MRDVVVARGLAQRYRSRRVLDGVDLDIGPGVTGLLGPNGAGKTTLLRTVCTLRRPAGGSLRVFGFDVARPRERLRIRGRLGYLPQSFGYYPGFTVAEFVRYAAWLKRVPAASVHERVAEAIDAVGLTARAGSRMRSLSGGMRRRAGIAQAIVHRPELLILDEPTAGLDPHQRIGLRRLIRQIGQHASVVLSTHLVEDVGVTCDMVTVLSDGGVAFRGTTDELSDSAEGDADGDSTLERGYSTVLTLSQPPARI